jgi:hypothetical protein
VSIDREENVFSLFHAPRRYPRVFAPYYESFNFYEGRDKWLESIRDVPEPAVFLFSVHWLHLEVYNGGFWQYFANSTCISCPEAIAGFNAIGMPDVTDLVEQSSKQVGEPFPYDMDVRRKIVGGPHDRMSFEDDRFYELADTNKIFRRVPRFVPFADAYADKLGY